MNETLRHYIQRFERKIRFFLVANSNSSILGLRFVTQSLSRIVRYLNMRMPKYRFSDPFMINLTSDMCV